LQSIPALLRLVPSALLFHGDAYRQMKERPRPVADGLCLLLLEGAVLGLAATVAAIAAWLASPDPEEVQRVLARGLAALPLAQRLPVDLAALLQRPLGLWALWRWVQPAPLPALLRLPMAPLILLAGWLSYGLLAHSLARLLGGRGRLRQTLGCTALAECPWLLLLFPLQAQPNPGTLGIAAWVWAARFKALRVAHDLDGWPAFWAALLPALTLAAAAGLLLLAWAAAGCAPVDTVSW